MSDQNKPQSDAERDEHFNALRAKLDADQQLLRRVVEQLSDTGYVMIERRWDQDVLVVYPSKRIAELAIGFDPFIDGLCEDDCLECYVIGKDDFSLIVAPNIEIILAEPFDTTEIEALYKSFEG